MVGAKRDEVGGRRRKEFGEEGVGVRRVLPREFKTLHTKEGGRDSELDETRIPKRIRRSRAFLS